MSSTENTPISSVDLLFRLISKPNELSDFLWLKVLNFFNSHIDTQNTDGEWSVEKILEVIINNCRSWRGEGMKV